MLRRPPTARRIVTRPGSPPNPAIVAVREGDAQQVEDAILQFSRKRRIYAPLALAVGAFVMLFSGLRLLVTNWRLMLVQVLPAMLIWAVTLDLKAHVLYGKQFHVIRGPLVLFVFAAVILLTMAAFSRRAGSEDGQVRAAGT